MITGSLSRRIVWREWLGHGIYPALFCLSLLVSLGAYLVLDSLQSAVDEYVITNQKAMVGGDVIIQANQPFSDEVKSILANIPQADTVNEHQFNGMAYANDASLLLRIKAIDLTYPLYGELRLSESNTWAHQLAPGHVLVERQVLTALNLSIGDRLTVGEAEFTIADEIIEEPDRPLTAFGFGARLIMSNDDLLKTGLMGSRSRIQYRAELRLGDEQAREVLNDLKQATQGTKTRVTGDEDANTSISQVSGNFLQFLKLLVVAVIVLSGVGLMSVVKAFAGRQQHTNAIRRALGEPISQLKNSYYGLLLGMAVLATVLAWGLSWFVIIFGESSFAAIIPAQVNLTIAWTSVAKVTLIALGLTFLMTHSTIQSLNHIKPVAVLHDHQGSQGSWRTSKGWVLLATLAMWALMTLEMGDVWMGTQVTVGLLVIALLFAGFSGLLLKGLKSLAEKGRIKHWLSRLAVMSIFRKGNHTMLFFTTLSMAIMVMGSIVALNHTIDQQLLSTYPENSPNMFLLDVQSDQHEALDAMAGKALTYYPVIRARIESVRGLDTKTLRDELGNYDNLERVFNLSYANDLLPTEFLERGEALFDEKTGDSVPVSMLSSFAEFLQVELGDEVVFNVQGITLKAHVSSIRKRHQRGPSPFFYFVFQPEVMASAPQIQFATGQVEAHRIPDIQTAIAKKFPGITTLNGASIAKQLKSYVDQLTQLIQIFTGLSVLAGLMIFISSLVSTSQDRLKDSAYFRLMGMLTKDLYILNIIEFVILGLSAFVAGGSLAWLATYIITTEWFNLPFSFPWQTTLMASATLLGTLILISLVYSRLVIQSNVMNLVRKMVG